MPLLESWSGAHLYLYLHTGYFCYDFPWATYEPLCAPARRVVGIMMRDGLRDYVREGRNWAPLMLAVGAVICLMAWGFSFSPAGVPLLILGAAVVLAAMVLRPTPWSLLAGVIVLFLALGGPIWVAYVVSDG